MRKFLSICFVLSMMLVGACVEDAVKLATIARLGQSQTIIGCTWDRTGSSFLPVCDYYY